MMMPIIYSVTTALLLLVFFSTDAGEIPEGLSINYTRSTSLKVQWKISQLPVNESFLWLVRVRHSQAYTTDSISVVGGTARNAIVEGLTPRTKYYISVMCYSEQALFCGLYNYEISATTKKAAIITVIQPRHVKVRVGNSAVLICEYEGHPQPSVYWLVGNTTVFEGSTDYGNYNTSVLTTDFSSKLTLFEAKGLRRRTVTCVAQNTFSTNKEIFTVEYYPQPVKDVTYIATLYNITVYWKYQQLGSGRFIGVFMEGRKRNQMETIIRKSSNKNVTSFILKDLEPLNDYILTIYVATTVGRSRPIQLRATTIFRIFESEKSKLPQAIAIVSGLAVIVLIIVSLFITSLILKYLYSKKAHGTLKKIRSKHEQSSSLRHNKVQPS